MDSEKGTKPFFLYLAYQVPKYVPDTQVPGTKVTDIQVPGIQVPDTPTICDSYHSKTRQRMHHWRPLLISSSQLTSLSYFIIDPQNMINGDFRQHTHRWRPLLTSFAKLELPEILRGMSTGPCWQGIYHDDHDDGDDDKSAIGNPERDVYRAMLARYLLLSG